MEITRKALMTALGKLNITVRDDENPFSSGNTGFYMGGRITASGEQYQVSCNIVKVKKRKAKKSDNSGRKLLK